MTVTVDPYDGVTYTCRDVGAGVSVLLLRGSSGPGSITDLGASPGRRPPVVFPTHPGWEFGPPSPESR